MSNDDQSMSNATEAQSTAPPPVMMSAAEMQRMQDAMRAMQAQVHAAEAAAQASKRALDEAENKSEYDKGKVRDPSKAPVAWIHPRDKWGPGGKYTTQELDEFCTQEKPQFFTEPGQWIQLAAKTNDTVASEGFKPPVEGGAFFPYAQPLCQRIQQVCDAGIRIRIYGDLCGSEPPPGYVQRHHYPEQLVCAACQKVLEYTKDGKRPTHFSDVCHRAKYQTPCPRCLLRFYCSENCRRSDWYFNHQYECAKHQLFRHNDGKHTLALGWTAEPFSNPAAPQQQPKRRA